MEIPARVCVRASDAQDVVAVLYEQHKAVIVKNESFRGVFAETRGAIDSVRFRLELWRMYF